MARSKNHLSPQFSQKIHAILFKGAPDEVTPAEFVLYLLETHKENGLYRPITRDEFSLKVKGRAHYFTELAANLANLTGTDPFFWRAESYSLTQAKDIVIDLTRPLPPTAVVTQPAIEGRVGSPAKKER